MCTESSPRISFSSDLNQSDIISPIRHHETIRKDTTLLDSNSDFEFKICRDLNQESYPAADEIFSNGMILPFTTQKGFYKYELPPLLPSSPSPEKTQNPKKPKENDKNRADNCCDSKSSFWGFNKSSSAKCDIKKSLICSFPLHFRSNSTGSVADNPNREILDDLQTHGSGGVFSSISTSVRSRKPALKKKEHGGDHVVRVSQPAAAYSVSKFSLRSILGIPKKDKKNKK